MKRQYVAALVAAMAMMGSGCAAVSPAVESTIAIIATTRTGATPLLSADGRVAGYVVDQIFDKLAEGAGKVSVIRADGQPEEVSTVVLEHDTTSTTTMQDSILANKVSLAKALRATRAQSAQADLITALSLAADAVRGQPSPAIHIIDSGLVTTGQVLMQTGLITPGTDPAALAARVSVGRLDGVTVYMHGLCSTSGPQLTCPEYAKTFLRSFYKDLVQRNGGRLVIDDAPLPVEITAADAGALPAVDPVPWVTAPISAQNTTSPPFSMVLTNDLLRFQPNTDNYVDLAAAQRVLAKVAAQLQVARYPSATVTGCTADDRPRSTLEAMRQRGQSRAEKVAADLRRLGATTILTPGTLGMACPGYVPTAPDSGRKVIISST